MNALPERCHLWHCLPEDTCRLEGRGLRQCQKWHLRRTRTVSARASGEDARHAAMMLRTTSLREPGTSA